MSTLEVRETDGTWVLFEDGAPWASPMGTRLWSRDRALMDAVLADAAVFGTNPGGYPSWLCLQSSYLDFARPTPADRLAGSLLPLFEETAAARYRGAAKKAERAAAVEASRLRLLALTRRQLTAVIVGAAHLGSAEVALRLADPDEAASLPQFARGLCGRSVDWFAKKLDLGEFEPPLSPWPAEWDFGDHVRWVSTFRGMDRPEQVPVMPPELRCDAGADRFVPRQMDDAFCRAACRASALVDLAADFEGRCAMTQVLARLRGFAALAEE